ncbi:MAG TPA: PadR family transcriptional regulator [Acidimicrobiales bacterium]|jgi:DNA-binding PadR family transcriptional regulator
MPTAASPASPPPAPSPTQTGYTLLGLLSFGRELSGYELKRWADNLRFFWSAPAMSQVYRELERLAAAGLVIQRSVVREGTRATKVYRLSAAGEQAVRAWLATPPGPPVLRHPVALRVFFGHLLDPAELRAAIESHRAWCDDMLAQLGEVRSELGDDARWRNAALVAEWGLDYYRGERAAVDGIEHAVSPLPEGPEAPVEPDEPGAELAG